MNMPLVAEKFLGLDFIDSADDQAFQDFCIDLEELHDVELEKELFTNLRHSYVKHASVLLYLLDVDTEVQYPACTRPRWEVRVGYKEAVRRGASLQETDVFNLLFTIKGRFQADGVAMMCHGPHDEEWIFLCPDDTVARIKSERAMYGRFASHLVLIGLMDSDWQNEVLENLQTLVPGTRCANSLMHEYGHVLQHRYWILENIWPHDISALYLWFVTIGYASVISARIPKFEEKPDETKIYLLKEAFVEDYRIGLNLENNEGIFELPNAYCFRGDFEDPTLMLEGVRIVKSTVQQNVLKNQGSSNLRPVSYEPDRVAVAEEIMADAVDFSTRTASRMTLEEHHAVVQRLAAKSKLQVLN